MWKYYALLSALFAALTAVFAKRYQFGFSHCHPNVGHPVYHLGNRLCREPYGRSERYQRTYMDIPYSVRCCHRPLVAVLFQGIADGRCIACGPDRQIERRHYDLPVVPAVERTGQCEGRCRSVADNGRKYGNASKISEYENIDYRRRTQPFG